MKKALILLVEDEIDLALTISARLKNAGFEVKIAEDGVDALQMIKKENFALIIMDIMMPNLDGFSFLAVIRANDKLKDVPVIVLTAMSDEDTKTKCLQVGADAFLTKPYDPDILLKIVEKVCKK